MAKPSLVAKTPPHRKREPLTLSQVMARVRSKNTKPEVVTRSAVHSLGLRFRNHVSDLPGKPDLANKKKKWAVFVHGCFWHSHSGCKLASSPKSNTHYWTAKLSVNRERDETNLRVLRALGFRVLVVWECQVRNSAHLGKALAEFFSLEATHFSYGSSQSKGDFEILPH